MNDHVIIIEDIGGRKFAAVMCHSGAIIAASHDDGGKTYSMSAESARDFARWVLKRSQTKEQDDE